MTPEEIAKQQQFSPESYLADLIREAVRNAYEDAARIVEKVGWPLSPHTADIIATAIRERGKG